MMKPLIVLLLSFASIKVEASIKAYFNHNQENHYTDPYRNISRPGDNLEQVIIDNINLARKSVYLAVQELRLPLVAKALVEQKKKGLDVRVVLENDYNFDVLSQRESPQGGEYEASKLTELKALVDINKNGRFEASELESRDAIYMLRKAGIPTMDDTSNNSQGSGLMHHKFMIVDGKTTLVSTANFTMSCIHGDMLAKKSRGNPNSLVQVNSVALAKIFTEEFLQLWGNGRRGNFGHGKTYRGPQTVTVRGSKITVQFSPTSRRYHWEESVNGLIAQHLAKARTSIKAALFVFSDQRLSNVMQKVSDRGAQIGALIEPKFAFRYYSELLDMLGLSMRNPKCGYEPDNNPWKNPATEVGMGLTAEGDVLHHKFAVVDQKTVVMGSQNWSIAANFMNDETLMVIQGNKEISDIYTQEYERIKKRSFLGVPERVMSEIEDWEEYCTQNGYAGQGLSKLIP